MNGVWSLCVGNDLLASKCTKITTVIDQHLCNQPLFVLQCPALPQVLHTEQFHLSLSKIIVRMGGFMIRQNIGHKYQKPKNSRWNCREVMAPFRALCYNQSVCILALQYSNQPEIEKIHRANQHKSAFLIPKLFTYRMEISDPGSLFWGVAGCIFTGSADLVGSQQHGGWDMVSYFAVDSVYVHGTPPTQKEQVNQVSWFIAGAPS